MASDGQKLAQLMTAEVNDSAGSAVGLNALHLTAGMGNYAIVEQIARTSRTSTLEGQRGLVLRHSSSRNPLLSGMLPIHFAVLEGHTKTIRALLSGFPLFEGEQLGTPATEGSHAGMTALHIAVANGALRSINPLLDRALALVLACEQAPYGDFEGLTPVHVAVLQDRPMAIWCILCSRGMKPQAAAAAAASSICMRPGRYAGLASLQMAVVTGSPMCVRELMMRLSLPDALNLAMYRADEGAFCGLNALHMAAAEQQADCMAAVLDCLLPIEAKSLKELVCMRVECAETEYDGMTALHIAAKLGASRFIDTVLDFLEGLCPSVRWALLNEPSSAGRTAAQVAQDAGHDARSLRLVPPVLSVAPPDVCVEKMDLTVFHMFA
jgi:hypothetical protein